MEEPRCYAGHRLATTKDALPAHLAFGYFERPPGVFGLVHPPSSARVGPVTVVERGRHPTGVCNAKRVFVEEETMRTVG